MGTTTDGASGAIYEFSPDQYFVTLTPINSFGVSTKKPRKIKEIIVAFGDDVRLELASSGDGEKTRVILALINTEEGENEASLKVLAKLSMQNENDLDFAKAIIEFYEVR